MDCQERVEAAKCGYEFLHGYMKLAQEARSAAYPNFKVRLKLHSFHHILWSLDQGDCLNPNSVACWNEETHVGRQCRVAKGTHPHTIGLRVLLRWASALLVHLSRSLESR